MDDWRAYAANIVAASATLVGLLFVALSVQLDRLRKSEALRERAFAAFALFTASMGAGLCVATPGQSTTVVGIELLVIAALLAIQALWLDRGATRATAAGDAEASLADRLGRLTPGVISACCSRYPVR